MDTLKLLQESNSKPLQNGKPGHHTINSDQELIDLFPLPRYFQVHFQHVHENTDALQSELAQLKQVVAGVDAKLEQLTALLSRSSKSAT
ncbi:hypothetical protein [Methylosarcina fibrata]|uniref:hypothetical protein n=1 Tax=Methylosarcina fibrata TaxID=105972 RepID=UPI0003768A9F|nr:hypothetical protein [Methylosarcina fibrata]